MNTATSPGPRSRARELIVQALYQTEISGHSATELLQQFHERPEYSNVDQPYFDDVLVTICGDRAQLAQLIDARADRPVSQLDPVEMAILLLGFHELAARPDIPYRVVINEAVDLAKKFGAIDGYKYINALLDRAAPDLRPDEDRA